jgi:hypothetical protein
MIEAAHTNALGPRGVGAEELRLFCNSALYISSPEEQLKRFEKRQDTPYKRGKLTPEEWRNREKWAVTTRPWKTCCCGRAL